jgi:hypothetical protein
VFWNGGQSGPSFKESSKATEREKASLSQQTWRLNNRLCLNTHLHTGNSDRKLANVWLFIDFQVAAYLSLQ